MPIWLVSIAKWLGHWLVYFILSAILVWGLYAGLVRPITHPNATTTQTGGVSYTIHVGFGGCARIPQATDVAKVTKIPVMTKVVEPIVKKTTPIVTAVKKAVKK